MFNGIKMAVTQPTPRQRIAILCACCVASVGGLGCATYLAANKRNPYAAAHYGKPILSDTICAIATPDPSLAKKIGQDAVAFLGQKHTYLLVQGGEELVRVGRELDGERLTIEGSDRRMFKKGSTIWGDIGMSYRLPDASVSDAATTNRLIELGFMPVRGGRYQKTIAVKGVTRPPIKIADVPAFKKCRDIAFFNPPNSSPPPDLSKLVLVPLGVATDILLTPVYLFGFTLIVISDM